jgi:hypothetical protein
VLDAGIGTNGALNSGNWEAIAAFAAPLQRSSNKLTANGSSRSASSWTTSFGPDQEAYVTLATAGDLSQLFLRGTGLATADPTAYALEADEDGVNLVKYVNGDWTPITSWPHTFANGDGFGASAIGNTITAYYRNGASGTWTALGSATDSSITAGGRIGLEADSTAVTLTNFGGGTRTPTSPLRTAHGAFTSAIVKDTARTVLTPPLSGSAINWSYPITLSAKTARKHGLLPLRARTADDETLSRRRNP